VYRQVKPLPEAIEMLTRVGGYNEFGHTRARQFWEAQQLAKSTIEVGNLEFDFDAGRNPVPEFFTQNPASLREPTRRERLEAETE
jgi:hypothetical protein